MAKSQSTGTCRLCNRELSKRAMTVHLKACLRKKAERIPREQLDKFFHVIVEEMYSPQYWLHLGVRQDAKLYNLDRFLRTIWFDPSDHLSGFEIGGAFYQISDPMEVFLNDADEEQHDPDEPEEHDEDNDQRLIDLLQRIKNTKEPQNVADEIVLDWHQILGSSMEYTMDVAVSDVLYPGLRFSYKYDFGSTTRLKLRVHSEFEFEKGTERVVLLAQNNPVRNLCDHCDAPAVYVCASCMRFGCGWLCEKHAQTHDCGERMLLPVSNSPRVGIL